MDSSVDEDASMLSMMVLSLSNWVRARKPAQGSERRPAALRRRHPCVCFLPLAGRDCLTEDVALRRRLMPARYLVT